MEKFADHTKSRSHKLAVTTHCQKENPIDSQLSRAKVKGMLDEDHELGAIPRQTRPSTQRK